MTVEGYTEEQVKDLIELNKKLSTEAVKFAKIKSIINNWAVDDDEHELLEKIADIINEEETNE